MHQHLLTSHGGQLLDSGLLYMKCDRRVGNRLWRVYCLFMREHCWLVSIKCIVIQALAPPDRGCVLVASFSIYRYFYDMPHNVRCVVLHTFLMLCTIKLLRCYETRQHKAQVWPHRSLSRLDTIRRVGVVIDVLYSTYLPTFYKIIFTNK